MMIRRLVLGLMAIAIPAGQARAEMVYDNGAGNGTIHAYAISSQTISNSFTVKHPTSLTSAQVGLNADRSNIGIPKQLDWAIGTTPGGTDVSSGTATLFSPLTGVSALYFLFTPTFAIDGTVDHGITYYFTLSHAIADNGGFVGWDVSNGPSSAFLDGANLEQPNDPNFPGTWSNSFRLFDATVAAHTPEPGGLTLAAIGMASFAGVAWRKRRRRGG